MIKNIFYKGFNDKNIFVVRSSLTNCTSAGNVDPLYCHPSYCPSDLLQNLTYDSCWSDGHIFPRNQRRHVTSPIRSR